MHYLLAMLIHMFKYILSIFFALITSLTIQSSPISEADSSSYTQRDYEEEIERKSTELMISRIHLWAFFTMAVLTSVFALRLYHEKRIISRKNHALAAQIAEALEYKDLKRQLENQIQAPQVQETADIDMSTMDDEQLFRALSLKIEHEKLYLDPDFDRQTLIDLTGLSKERIAAFSRGGKQISLPGYINVLRLEHASRLLIDQSGIDIDQVARESGFASRKYFSSKFKAHFSISPTEFRQARL